MPHASLRTRATVRNKANDRPFRMRNAECGMGNQMSEVVVQTKPNLRLRISDFGLRIEGEEPLWAARNKAKPEIPDCGFGIAD